MHQEGAISLMQMFSNWQYIDQLVYWGGSAGEGIIVPPSPDVTDAAHKNGVPVLGTIFFPQGAHGGKIEWLNTFRKRCSRSFSNRGQDDRSRTKIWV